MTVELRQWVLPTFETNPGASAVDDLAVQLLDHLNEPLVLRQIETANQPGQASSDVQAVFLNRALELGFRSEAKGLFAEYDRAALRPDYYRPLGDTGIILEVERGKTTINNMDLLDFWKCHICGVANVLFLMVPKALRQNPTMSPRNELETVSTRLARFFVPGNETNVWALYLFGY